LGRSDLADRSLLPWNANNFMSLNDLLVCPSDLEKMAMRTPESPTSLVCNAGREDAQATAQVPADWRPNAVFVNRNDRDNNGKPLKLEVTDASFIGNGDGLAMTLLLSENIDARTWYNLNADET